MTDILNQTAEKWFSWQLSMFWQVGLLIVIVAGLDLLIKRWVWPQVRYTLWLLILVKLVLPPTLTSPMSFTAEIPFMVKQTLTNTNYNTDSHRQMPIIIKPVESITVSPRETIQPIEIVSATPINIHPTPAVSPLSPKSYVFILWLAGVGILSGWLIIRLSSLRRQHIKSKVSNLPERLEILLASTTQKLGLRKSPQVILTNKVFCPAVFGLFKPILLMPADKLRNMTTQDAEHIFLHELAHIKRGDLFVHAFYMILQIVYWFNPLLWLIRKHIQNLRELCCDATVAKILREKTVGYRQTLLETARELLAKPVEPGLGLLGLFENSSWLVDRLNWLEKKSWRFRPLRITTVFVLICLMSAFVLPMTKFEAPADFVIKGTVTDAQTGKPVANAKVGDVENYAEGKYCTTTDMNGTYSYKTYYEEHGVKAAADGYKQDMKGFGTKIFRREKEKVINFALEPNADKQTEKKQKLINLVEDFFKDNYRDIKNRKTIEYGEPIIEDNGNQTIRYKYEANIWDNKDRYIFNELFTFNPDGKYVSAKKISMILKDYPADNDSSAGQKPAETLKKDYIPKTSTIDEQGRIVDKIDYPFINDAEAIGSWESVDFVRNIKEFKPGMKSWYGDLFLKELYLLEGGKTSLGYTWTKGLLLHSVNKTASKYIIKDIDGSKYMFLEWKSGDYTIRHEKPFYYVLKQNKDAVFVESRTIDKIDYPFVNDPRVLGKWQSVDFVERIEQFTPGNRLWPAIDLYLKGLVFLPNGKMSVPWYTWTKGLVIHAGNQTASKYTIKTLQGADYMFFEWKSGDYTIRGMKPKYYVLKKETAENVNEINNSASNSNEYPIDFEIIGKQFKPGDAIKIIEIRGSADKIQVGQTYTVKGKYKLSSAGEALLHIYATNGEVVSEQGPVIKWGTGDFSRTFKYKEEGQLHLSFYPTNGGSGFGNIYFAQKGSGQKKQDYLKDEKTTHNPITIASNISGMLSEMQPSFNEIKKEGDKLKQLKAQNAPQAEIDASEKRIKELEKQINELGNKWGAKMEWTGEQLGKDIHARAENNSEYWKQFGEKMAEWGKQFGEQMQNQCEQTGKTGDNGKSDFEKTEELSAPFADGSLLAVNIPNGGITVIGGIGAECKVTAEIRARASTTSEAEQIAKQVKINLKQESGKTIIAVDNCEEKDVSVYLNITVPRKASLECRVGDGSMTCSKLEGRVSAIIGDGFAAITNLLGDASVMLGDGEIKYADSKGSLDAQLGDGEIIAQNVEFTEKCDVKLGDGQLTFENIRGKAHYEINIGDGTAKVAYAKDADGVGHIEVDVADGKIEFGCPANMSAKIEAQTKDGTIQTSLPLTVERNEDSSSLEGTLGTGEGHIELDVKDGSIIINANDGELTKWKQNNSNIKTNPVPEPNQAKSLRITIYENNNTEPDINVRIPLVAMKIARKLLPSKDKLQIIAQKMQLDESMPQGMDCNTLIDTLDEMLTKVDHGVESTTLVDYKDQTEKIAVVLE